ncbi:methyl-CpG-binding domain-containing protein 11-like isoform X2 [Aristolochia californica]|uniref:methyl-CpG-binding domain-containing protein 11-like isoform X2 n=1 Tax=Aristolochia californica TaxID=171875 RepID=UPI0035DD3500
MVTSEDKMRNSASENQSMADRDQNPADVVSVDLPAPAGWMKKFIPRKWGTPKRNEIVFISSTGEEIKSKRQLDQYLRSHPGGPSSSDFDWGTGDTPRRSARISEKLKASETPEHEPPKKRQRKLSLKESKEKNDGEEDQEMTGKEDKDVEGQSETLEKEKEDETEAPQEGKKDCAETVKPTEEALEKEKEDETEAPQEGENDGAETVKPTEEALEKEKEDETEAPQKGKKDGAETVEPTEERSSSNVVTENPVEEKKDEETHAQEEPTAVASVDEEMKDAKERDDEVVPSEEGDGLKDAADGETKQQNQNMAENLENNEQKMVAKEDNSNEKQSGELKEEKEQPESEVMVEANAQGGPEVKEDKPKENSSHGDIESKPSHQSSISCEDGKHPPKASPVSC